MKDYGEKNIKITSDDGSFKFNKAVIKSTAKRKSQQSFTFAEVA